MKIPKEFKIGISAIIVLALSVWGYNFLKGKNILQSTDEYFVIFNRIDGLIESGAVYYKGFKVGNINSIEFDNEHSGKFILRIVLEEKLRIPINSVVNVKSTNPIASAKDLEIIYSDSKELHYPGDTLQSAVSPGLTDFLGPLEEKIEDVLTEIDTLLVSFNNILTAQSQQKLKNGISDLTATLNLLNNSLSENGNLNKTFQNVESVTSNLASKNEQISTTLDNLSDITTSLDSADLNQTIAKLDSTLSNLNEILAKIERGEGTAGKIISDSSLYLHLDSTAYHLNLLMKDLQENPKRYVHFSLFGNKKD
ncbi:MAG: MCE family protein [Bacteroidales bacterium]|nr:MCE family protein [Bacteroidales bacterium]